jgi:hypothetical protein
MALRGHFLPGEGLGGRFLVRMATLVRRAASVAAAVAVSATSLTAIPVTATAAEDYRVRIIEKSPRVQYFRDFTYDVVKVSGPDSTRAARLTQRIARYVMPSVRYYLKPDADTRDFLKRARPAGFNSIVASSVDCRSGYVCITQGTVFTTPLIAGSITDIRARAWSTATATRAQLRDFVSASELPAFTREVKKKIRRDACYYGFAIDLPADYDSFPHWVPVENGIEIWFPEYQFGCTVMNFTVPWR